MSAHTAVVAVLVTAAVLCALCAQAKYTPDAAMSALYFAKASSCDGKDINGWSCDSCKAHPTLCLSRVYIDTFVGTQAYVGVDDGRIVVAFRGSVNVENWIHNFKIFRTAYSGCEGCSVHSGFLDSYNSLKTSLLDNVRKLVKAHPGHSILVTGHSLGGAMATLAAADIAQPPLESGAWPHIDLYTFGSPRVGNQKFADWFANIFCFFRHGSYRVTHTSDIVPHLPPLVWGFRHVSQEIFYNNDGDTDWEECKDIKEDTRGRVYSDEYFYCSNSFPANLFSPHDLYLGKRMGCAGGGEVRSAMRNVEVSAELKSMLAEDYAYLRRKVLKNNTSLLI